MLPEGRPPTLEWDGLRVRPLRGDDALAFYGYLQNPAVTERTCYPPITMAFVEAMLERYRQRWAAGELSKWGIVRPPDDQLIGTCGFNDWSPTHRWAELAYDLAQDHWGTGVMKHAVRGVLQWAFDQHRIDRVLAYVRWDNQRSMQFIERLGFVREGCLRSYRICRGQPHDFIIYGLLRHEWTSQPQP